MEGRTGEGTGKGRERGGGEEVREEGRRRKRRRRRRRLGDGSCFFTLDLAGPPPRLPVEADAAAIVVLMVDGGSLGSPVMLIVMASRYVTSFGF